MSSAKFYLECGASEMNQNEEKRNEGEMERREPTAS